MSDSFGFLSTQLISQLNDEEWKTRSEAIVEVQLNFLL